jgi:hypothetical protein
VATTKVLPNGGQPSGIFGAPNGGNSFYANPQHYSNSMKSGKTLYNHNNNNKASYQSNAHPNGGNQRVKSQLQKHEKLD